MTSQSRRLAVALLLLVAGLIAMNMVVSDFTSDSVQSKPITCNPSSIIGIPQNITKCALVKATFLPNKFREPFLLWSSPGSGNSLLRVLIEQATGYLSGSVYHSDKTLRQVFAGEKHCGNDVIVVKMHYNKPPLHCAMVQDYRNVIALVRHPVKALFAEYQRKVAPKSSNKHITPVLRSQFNKTHFESSAVQMATRWASDHHWRYSDPSKNILTLKFEDLINPISGPEQLTGILKFLDVCNLNFVNCAFQNSDHPLIHRQSIPEQLSITEAISEDLLNVIWDIVGTTARRWDYTKDNWRPRQKVHPK